MEGRRKIVKLNNASGVTLIALTITIIVLIILAGVSIATMTDDNGTIKNAQNAARKATDDSVKNAILTLYTAYDTYDEFYADLKEKSYINDDGVVDIEKLLGDTSTLGSGSVEELKNVYVIENKFANYDDIEGTEGFLYYYDDENNKEPIIQINTIKPVETNYLFYNQPSLDL